MTLVRVRAGKVLESADISGAQWLWISTRSGFIRSSAVQLFRSSRATLLEFGNYRSSTLRFTDISVVTAPYSNEKPHGGIARKLRPQGDRKESIESVQSSMWSRDFEWRARSQSAARRLCFISKSIPRSRDSNLAKRETPRFLDSMPSIISWRYEYMRQSDESYSLFEISSNFGIRAIKHWSARSRKLGNSWKAKFGFKVS